VAAWPSGTTSVGPSDAGLLNLRRRWLRRWLYYDGQKLLRLRRISKRDADALRRAIDHLALAPAITTAVAWYRETTTMLGAARAEQRWVPGEAIEAMLADRPPQGLLEQAQAARVAGDLSRSERAALELLEVDLEGTVAETNASIMAAELVSRRGFFATVERTPLTEEQAKAVVCFDNRVQVLAAAGSGKTSVMVARAAYAVARGFVHPEHILLLAFNKSAADELQERVEARFAAAGMASAGVKD
jgi:DNA helicase-4